MIRIFLLLLVCVAGTWFVADAIRESGPGYVYIAFGHYSLETSVWFGLLLQFFLIVCLFLLVKLLTFFFYYLMKADRLPRFLLSGRARKLHYQGELAFLTQQWQLAGKKLGKAARNSDNPFLDYVMACRACLAANDIAMADHYLGLAENAPHADAKTLALLKFDVALIKAAPSQQYLLIDRALQEKRHSKIVLERATEIYLRNKQWDKLQSLLPLIRKQKVLGEAAWQAVQDATVAGLMEKINDAGQKTELRKLWRQAGKEATTDAVFRAYCATLQRLGERDEARKLLERRLQQHYSDEIMEQYAVLQVDDKQAWLAFAESFLGSQKQSYRLLACLGEMARQNGFQARARDYVQRSLNIKPSVHAYELLADIATEQQDNAHSQSYLRKALILAKQEI